MSPLRFCVKIFYMKAKKIILTTTALLGVGAVAFGAAKVVQEQKRLRSREEIVRVVREFFASRGPIATAALLEELSEKMTVISPSYMRMVS